MTIRGLQRLLMILGGKVAAEFREIIEGTFTRVMAGDQSLIEVINANAASQAPVQQAYRAALAQEPVAPALDELCLGKKRGRNDLLFDMKMAERKLALEETQLRLEDGKLTLEERKLQHDSKLIEHVNTAMRSINALKDLVHVDESTKVQAKEHIKNALFNKTASSSTDGSITAPKTSIPPKDQSIRLEVAKKDSKICEHDHSSDDDLFMNSDDECKDGDMRDFACESR